MTPSYQHHSNHVKMMLMQTVCRTLYALTFIYWLIIGADAKLQTVCRSLHALAFVYWLMIGADANSLQVPTCPCLWRDCSTLLQKFRFLFLERKSFFQWQMHGSTLGAWAILWIFYGSKSPNQKVLLEIF